MVKDKYILGYSGLAYYDERIKDYISNISHSESGLTQEIIARQSGDTFLLETKQDKLEEGHGIVIENNVISTNIINDETVETGKTYSSVKIMDIVNGVSFAIEIVDELPISGEPRTIYFVPKEESGETSNIYYEYLYINNEWEKIGDTEIDLSGYYTKEEIDEIIDSIYDDLLTLNSGLTEVVDFVNTLATIIETKQDKLTSGYNIRISGNTIEAIGYKYEEETGDFTIKTNPAIGSRLPLPIGDSEDVNSVNVRQDGDVFIIGVGGYEGDNEESSIALQDVINNSISAITIADSALSIEIENRIAGDTILEESINELSGVVDEIETELDGKQDKLTAGDNISIKNNTISAIGYHFDETKGSFAEWGSTISWVESSQAMGYSAIINLTGEANSLKYTYSGETQDVYAAEYLIDMVMNDYGYDVYLKISNDRSARLISMDTENKVFAMEKTLDSSNSLTNETVLYYGGCERITNHAYGLNSHAEGTFSCAYGDYSHAECGECFAYGNASHAEGSLSVASGYTSHAEGSQTHAEGSSSHSEGVYTYAYGNNSHAEGASSYAHGEASHSEGAETVASGNSSHAEGVGTQTINTGEHAEGSFNQTHAFTVSTIGIGTNNDNRKNAVEVLYTGDVYINGIGGYNGSEITVGTTKTLQNVIENIGDEISVTVQEVLDELNNED